MDFSVYLYLYSGRVIRRCQQFFYFTLKQGARGLSGTRYSIVNPRSLSANSENDHHPSHPKGCLDEGSIFPHSLQAYSGLQWNL